MLNKIIIVFGLAVAAAAAAAASSDFYVVVPLKGRTGHAAPVTPPPSTATPVSPEVTLAAASLPSGQVGQTYNFDFKSVLQVTGDPQYTDTAVRWTMTSGAPPAGLQLDASSGLLSGALLAAGSPSFTLTATYKSMAGQQQYTVVVQNNLNIVQAAGYRAWADGSLARSCNDYRNPGAGRQYAGATGDGVYRVALPSGALNVVCDMTTDGGGWTKVMNAVAGQVAGWQQASGGLNTAFAADPSQTSKLADSDIQALTTVALRLTSTVYNATRYVAPTCRYSHITIPSVANGCGTTYSSLAWTNAKNFAYTGAVATGISDVDTTTDVEYFQSNDTRGYGWFVGNYAPHEYRSGSGYRGGAGFVMWAK